MTEKENRVRVIGAIAAKKRVANGDLLSHYQPTTKKLDVLGDLLTGFANAAPHLPLDQLQQAKLKSKKKPKKRVAFDIDGSDDAYASDIYEYLQSMEVGVGMSMEGIEQNPIIYDLMSEMAFRHNKADVKIWVDQYSNRRYGRSVPTLQDAWNILYSTLYNCTAPMVHMAALKHLMIERIKKYDYCLPSHWFRSLMTPQIHDEHSVLVQQMDIVSHSFFSR